MNQAKTLERAVSDFADFAADLSDDELEIEWIWHSYSEGVRFAFFRVLEELEDLAARLLPLRAEPLTETQLILAQHHAAHRDLHCLLRGLADPTGALPPAEGDWPIRDALAHLIGADLGFFVTISFALETHRAGRWTADASAADEDWDRILDMNEDSFNTYLGGPVSVLREGHGPWHARILSELATITAQELDLPARFWEQERHPIRFRLHRFTAHNRQHTIQIEKALHALGGPPTEAGRLIRHIFGALAQVENARMGEPRLGADHLEAAANRIDQYTTGIRAALHRGATP